LGNGVEVSNFVGTEVLEELSEALDEPVFPFADVVAGLAKLQENLVVCRGRVWQSAFRGREMLTS
jgi:hypothetical protein